MISRRALMATAAACGMAALASCAQAPAQASELQQETFFCFDTACAVGVAAGPAEEGQRLVALAQDECARYERLFSRTIATSDVGRVNAAGGEPVPVSPDTLALLSAALDYAERSGGLFDVTIGAVSELWDFHAGVVPAPQAVEAALPSVGWRGVELDEAAGTVRLENPNTRLDLGGIAKGFVADALLARLAAEGATSAFVNLGGNVAVRGGKPDGSAWTVGVRSPEDETASVARVPVRDGSVVTSGLYERSFVAEDGVRYWHILDPRTGYPVQTGSVSATVVAAASLAGEGLTKPLFFMAPDDALAWLREQERADGASYQALIVTDGGELRASEGSDFSW